MLPLCSSRQILNALIRCGCQKARTGRGSHQALTRKLANGDTLTIVVPMGNKEVPRPTPKSILKQARLSEKEFLDNLK